MAEENKVKKPADQPANDEGKVGGQPAPATTKKDETPKPVDAGGTPPAPRVDPPKPDDGKGKDDERPRPRFDWRAENRRLQGNLEAAESEAAKANEELNKLRGQIKDGKGNDGELRKQIAEAEAKAKAAIAAAEKKAAYAQAQAAAAGGHQPPKPPTTTATGTVEPPKDPGTKPEPKRPDPPTPTPEPKPVRREPEPRPEPQPRQPDPPRPTRTDDCGDGNKCCCHPFTTTWLLATVIAILVAALGMLGWWLATKSSSSVPSTSPAVTTAPAPAPDPLAADKGEFLTHCQLNGGTFVDCLNGFEASTR